MSGRPHRSSTAVPISSLKLRHYFAHYVAGWSRTRDLPLACNLLYFAVGYIFIVCAYGKKIIYRVLYRKYTANYRAHVKYVFSVVVPPEPEQPFIKRLLSCSCAI